MERFLFLLMLPFLGCGYGKVVVPPLPSPPVYSEPTAAPDDTAVLPQVQLPPTTNWRVTEPLASEAITKIMVSVPEQMLYAYHGDTVIRTVKVSTALGPTMSPDGDMEGPHGHVGVFSVYKKDDNHISGEYGSPMPFAMFFHKGHAIHATEKRFYDLLGTPASHGCVRTNLDDAKWLFERTAMGTLVIVEGPLTMTTKAKASSPKPATKPKPHGPDLARSN